MLDMYLTIRQHDLFRNLLMGFEIPFRSYIAHVVTSAYPTDRLFENAMVAKKTLLTPASPEFLNNTLPKACSNSKMEKAYAKFQTAKTSVDEIVSVDIDIPMVGALNLVTFALTEDFSDLYTLFGSYSAYCDLAEKYRYARNKLDHPGSRTLEDSHLVPVLSFVKDICNFLDEKYFLQKNKQQLLNEINVLQQPRIIIPVDKHNFPEMPYGESRLVCRDLELHQIIEFVYGKPDSLRKQHSLCVYGYGGVGKTVLVLESLKQIVGDICDKTTVNEYNPKYIFFFSAKKRKLALAPETGKFIEQKMRCHFETADELKELIKQSLAVDNFRTFHDEGLIVVDNLETLSIEERKKVKDFIETGTPSEMQFLLTSRNSEEYEINYKLSGFEAGAGRKFIDAYCDENMLDIEMSGEDKDQLLTLSKGNTLVLVLSLRRLSQHLSTVSSLKSEFSTKTAWRSIRINLSNVPSNAYEVIGQYMYKDTFEHIEHIFSENADLFYKVLKVFAVIQNESTDISTICLLTKEAYPNVEAVIDVLCNFLILEKKDTQYNLNSFAEKYVIDRFLPDAETYDQLSTKIAQRQREVQSSLEQLQYDIQDRPALARIIRDWQILTEIDRITASKMYRMYGQVKTACEQYGRFKAEGVLEEFVKECMEAESVTAHPFIKYQKARILQVVDSSNVFSEKHVNEIKKAFTDAIYSIKTIEQYAGIQKTKSYAALQWLFGQYLSDIGEIENAMRYLEDSKQSFEELNIQDTEYYQCITKLASIYLDYYLKDRSNRLSYLRRARGIDTTLSQDWGYLGKARSHAGQLRTRLQGFGPH